NSSVLPHPGATRNSCAHMDTETFGTILGRAPGNVPVYSSDYASADSKQFPNRKSFRSFVDGVFMGYKWQCVEFVRRWLYFNMRYVFDDVSMAYDIFRLRSVRKLSDDSRLPLHSFRNGALRRPDKGSLLIWEAAGEFELTGHVAVVTEVGDDFIRIAEQNVDNRAWPEQQNFSRQLAVTITAEGGYLIDPGQEGDSILGWVIQTSDATHAEDIADIDMTLFRPLLDTVESSAADDFTWVDTRNPAGAAYAAGFGHRLTRDPSRSRQYFCLSETAFAELKRATNELHHLFLRATEYVLKDDQLLDHFNIPRALWPKIKTSWNNRRNSMITGRFDFSISENGLRVYEYNADSASCYFETACLQEQWAAGLGCDIGRSPGEDLYDSLVRAWKARGIKDVLHIMQDEDAEETYHALFMKSAIEEAGIDAKILTGVSDLHWSNGSIVDSDNIPIKRVWKTWAWETVLDQIRDELEDHDTEDICLDASASPRLADALLRPTVVVNEPFWTLIPSNKAILPVMWALFPDRPYLLNSQFELTADLLKSGYVEKPIVGRSGENIVIADTDDVIDQTEGRFGNRKRIYQSLFRLPEIAGLNVQLCAFAVAGAFAGACVRVDPSLVIRGESDVMPLRIVSDSAYRKLRDRTG
ncbi:MAG: glutathionylspermidine synthase family protein, partial [Desulfofustis sp.]|nr:glutathionylspermidine synthase family protein [Desulfofustis sp.]